jgi:hypothetical protein
MKTFFFFKRQNKLKIENKINYIDDGEREHQPPKIEKYPRGTPKGIQSL